MPHYTITEPHPTVAANTYTHSGRGGAGNTFRVSATTSASGVPSAARPAAHAQPARFYSGRGGAGNVHSAAERVALSFAEEYSAAAQRDAHANGHVGRGGAGNVYHGAGDAASQASSRRDSASTGGSVRSGFWARLSGQH